MRPRRESRADEHGVLRRLQQDPSDVAGTRGRGIQDREGDGHQHEQLEQDDGGRERRVPQHVERDGDADVVAVHLPGGQRADDGLADRSAQDQRRDQGVDPDDDGGGDHRHGQQRREQRRHVGLGEHGEEQERRQDVEGQPAEHVSGVGPEQVDPRDDIAHDDREAHDGEAREDAAHAPGSIEAAPGGVIVSSVPPRGESADAMPPCGFAENRRARAAAVYRPDDPGIGETRDHLRPEPHHDPRP